MGVRDVCGVDSLPPSGLEDLEGRGVRPHSHPSLGSLFLTAVLHPPHHHGRGHQ